MPPAARKPITAAPASAHGEVSARMAERPVCFANASTRWRRAAMRFSTSKISWSGGIIVAPLLRRFGIFTAQLSQQRSEWELFGERQGEPAERGSADEVQHRGNRQGERPRCT